jgi:hypothetical protein
LTAAQAGFVVFGLTSQALLVAFFAARRWWPNRAQELGKAAYGFGALGLPLAIWLLLTGPGDGLFIGPLLMAAWACLGASVDLWRPRPWRGPPVEWKVLAPYIALYFSAQMFMWWPLWRFARGAWAVFLVLFVLNTALNLEGHGGPRSRRMQGRP